MELSWIQKHVLLVLIRQRSARVKDLTPRDIASNLFAYHLDGLLSAKLIEKSARGIYQLTTKGEKYVSQFSTALDRRTEMIKTVIVLCVHDGEKHLLFRWNRQPFIECVTPPYDHVALGKSLQEGLVAASIDKLGAQLPLTFKTSALIKIIHDEQIISHMNALIYTVSVDDLPLPFVARNGEAFLGSLSDTPGVMDGVAEFLQVVDDATQPFESEWRY